MGGSLLKVYFSFQWVCSWSLAANARALQNAVMWLGAVGAGPAFLGMLLRCRGRIRRALACVGLASAVAIHCVVSWLLGVTLVVTGANGHGLHLLSGFSAVAFILFAVGDALAALALLRRPRARGSRGGVEPARPRRQAG